MLLATMASILVGDSAAQIILDQIKGKNQQLDALRAVAAEKIADPETRDLLKPLFKLINKSAEARNLLAHRLWGTTSELPDALLLTKTEAAVKFGRTLSAASGTRTVSAASQTSVSLEQATSMENDRALAVMEILRQGTEVWTQEDFQKPRLLLNRAVVALSLYTTAISGPTDDPATKQARRQLTEFLKDTEKHY